MKAIFLCKKVKQVDSDLPCLLVDKEFRKWEICRGAEADYHRLTQNYGLKVFLEKDSCQFAYKKQKQISKTGRAPEVVGKIIPVCVVPNNITSRKCYEDGKELVLWGYITEHVRVFDYCVADSVFEDWDQSMDSSHPYWKAADELANYFERYYNVEYDGHNGNYGITSKGKVVMIDFGEISFE